MTKWNLLSLGLAAIVVLFLALFPYYSGSVVQAIGTPEANKEGPNASTKTASFGISGMTCPSCAKGLEASYRNMPGVKEANVDYEAKQATVTFDPAKQSNESIKKLVAQAGYTVTKK